jgi:nickel-type superoxide dismutase maturation protease
MMRVFKVTGESLSPGFNEGDFVVLTTVPFSLNRLAPGDVIVFRHPFHGVMIKRVEWVDQKEASVVGSHADSVDSRRFGPIPRKAIIGKVIWHIPRRT